MARFADLPFRWGAQDCLRLAAFHLRQLGHAPPVRQAGEYRSLLGAHRALKRTGYATFAAWIDSWGLRRIAPAMAMPGDLLGFETGVEGWPALSVVMSGGRVFGFYGDPPTGQLVRPQAIAMVWAVL